MARLMCDRRGTYGYSLCCTGTVTSYSRYSPCADNLYRGSKQWKGNEVRAPVISNINSNEFIVQTILVLRFKTPLHKITTKIGGQQLWIWPVVPYAHTTLGLLALYETLPFIDISKFYLNINRIPLRVKTHTLGNITHVIYDDGWK